MPPSSIGVIGLDAAGIALAKAVALHPDLTLTGVADPQQSRGASAATQLGVAFAPNPHDFIGDAALDGLIVAGDLADRSAVLAAAADRGRTLLTLTPPAASLNALDDLILRAAQSAARIICASPLRSMIPCQQAARSLAEGTLGKPLAVFASHRTKSEPGDLLIELGLPLLDFLVDAIGEPATAVQATAAALFDDAPDTWQLIVSFRSGLVATVEVGRLLPNAYPATDELRIEFTGTDHVIVVEPTNQALTIHGTGGTRRSDHSPDVFRTLVDDFSPVLRDGAEPQQSLVTLRWVMPLIEAARQSAARGEPVSVG